MLVWYIKFCCGIFYLLRDSAKSDIPYFATFMFTLFLFVLSMSGIESLIYLLFKTKDYLSKFLMYGIVVMFAAPNYFYVFKDGKFLKYYHKKLPSSYVLAIVILIFVGSLVLILQAGPRVVVPK
jgi:hypothetical protein